MVLFPDVPPAQPWEYVLVDKIFQKGGDGSQGIARYLSRHVRANDHHPPGAILNADFRRSIAELNVTCDDDSYDAVARSCAFQDALEPPGRSLSVRALASRLANLAQSSGGMSAVHAVPGPSPMTGHATRRVTLAVHEAARHDAQRGSINDPDYYGPDRGMPSSPRAPPAGSDPNSLLYDNRAGSDFAGIPAPARGKPMNHQSPEFREAFTPSTANDTVPAASPDREALLAWERHKKSDVAAGRVAPVGVPPTTAEYPLDYVPDPMPVLDTVEKVEEAVRSVLLVRTGNRAAAMRILGGMHSAGGRLRSGDALTVEQFRDAMLRLNVNPADDAVVAAVFRKHDTNGDGSLDYQEFVRYLLPGDFETTSPREYRKAYEGYSEPTRAVVSGDETESGPVSPAGTTTPRGTRGAQRPGMVQEPQLRGRDARMHGLLPTDAAAPGRATAGAPSYQSGLFTRNPNGGDHDLTVRRVEAAVLERFRGANGGDATTRQAIDLFKFFDDDRTGRISLSGVRAALRRLNIDASDDAFAAFAEKYDDLRAPDGTFDYREMAKRLVPPSEQEKATRAKISGGIGERWGADDPASERWAGYDRDVLERSLEKMQEPAVFDRGVAGDAGYVPVIKTARELEELLREKTLERTSSTGRGARAWWKYFDRDGSGAMDRGEFETALKHFNIAATSEVLDEVIRRYDTDGDGEIDYVEMLRCLVPDGEEARRMDTVSFMKRLDVTDRGAPPVRSSPPRLELGAPRPVTHVQNTQRITVPAFRRMLLDWMSTRGQGLKGLRKLFKDFDTDDSGIMDHDEFAKGIQRMNIHPAPEDLRAIIAHYDEDGNGTIEFDEFVRSILPEHEVPGYEAGNWQSIAHHDPKPPNILPTSHMLYGTQLEALIRDKVIQKADKGGSARRVFRELDWDHSGTVSVEELRAWLTSMNIFPNEETFDGLWRRYDPTGRGFISYQGFVDRMYPQAKSKNSVF